MKLSAFAALLAITLIATPPAWAQTKRTVPIAGAQTLGVSVTELQTVMQGWSAKHNILGKEVYNDKNERIGTVDDLIITTERTASYAIVGVGGFLKVGAHEVAVPANQLQISQTRIVLPGANKEALEKMPAFRYSKRK